MAVGWIIGFRNLIRRREPALGWRGTWSVLVPSKCPPWSAVWSSVRQCGGPVWPGRGPGSYKPFSQFLPTHGPALLASYAAPHQSSKGPSQEGQSEKSVQNRGGHFKTRWTILANPRPPENILDIKSTQVSNQQPFSQALTTKTTQPRTPFAISRNICFGWRTFKPT